MILIDTNVVSELMRSMPAPAVLDWFGRQDAAGLHLSAVGEAELRRGALILPAGRRRDRLIAEINALVWDDFGHRVLPFDSAAAQEFAAIFADRRAAGRGSVSLTVRLLPLPGPTGPPLPRATGGISRDAGSRFSTRGRLDERRLGEPLNPVAISRPVRLPPLTPLRAQLRESLRRS